MSEWKAGNGKCKRLGSNAPQGSFCERNDPCLQFKTQEIHDNALGQRGIRVTAHFAPRSGLKFLPEVVRTI